MRCFFFASLVVGALAVCPAVGTAQQPDPAATKRPPGSTELADNAALQYWQAFSQMPTLSDEQGKLLQDWNKVDEWHKVPLDPEAQKLIGDSYTALMYLHRGAKLERCDWGLDYSDGISLLLPHLAKARDLARLAALRARSDMENGRFKSARADLTAIMALARHVGRDPIMISLLVQFGLEGMVVDLVAPYVPEMKAPHGQAVAMFEGLPKGQTVQQALRGEKEFFLTWMVRKLNEEERRQPGAGLALWKNFIKGAEAPPAVLEIDTVSEATKAIEGLMPVYDRLGELLELPHAEFEAKYPAFKDETKVAQPLAEVIVPDVHQLLAKERRSQARLAMLLAAVAVAESGPDKLKELRDPFGDGPFEYRPLEQGFELKSKLLYEGQPVTLTVGRKTAKPQEPRAK